MIRRAAAAAMVQVVVGCLPEAGGGADVDPRDGGEPAGEAPYTLPALPRCAGAYAGVPAVLGHLGDEALVELSGLVQSPTEADLLWAHNDSGNEALLFALRADGRARGRVRLPFSGADVEDMAVASCPDRRGPCLYLADTGNNAGARDDQAIYVVAEPPLTASGTLDASATAAQALRIDASPRAGLPAGIDVEAIAVLPDASALVLFEKVDADDARVFALRGPFVTTPVADGDRALDGSEPGRFVEIGTVRTESPAGVMRARMITGAAMHPAGTALAIRTYSGVFELPFEDSEGLLSPSARLTGTVTFGPLTEPQGEAVTYDATGTGIITISEARDRPASEVPVNLLACR